MCTIFKAFTEFAVIFLLFCILHFFWSTSQVGLLASQPAIEPVPPVLEVPTTGLPRKSWFSFRFTDCWRGHPVSLESHVVHIPPWIPFSLASSVTNVRLIQIRSLSVYRVNQPQSTQLPGCLSLHPLCGPEPGSHGLMPLFLIAAGQLLSVTVSPPLLVFWDPDSFGGGPIGDRVECPCIRVSVAVRLQLWVRR